MIELQTLGALQVAGPEVRRLGAVEAQPKRLALLLFVALSPGSRRRDVLLAAFWPDLDQQRARAALRQSVWFLRRYLGTGVIRCRGEEITIDRDGLRCDSVMFQRFCAVGDFVAALDLYRGDLADGFFVSGGSPDFEHWLEGERARLRRMAVDAAGALARAAEARADSGAALHWARRAAALAPDDESALRKLLVAHDRAGDRAGALAIYERFRRQVAAEFGATPAPETEALVGKVQARRTTTHASRGLTDASPDASSPGGPPANGDAALRRAEAHTALGLAYTHYMWRWDEAERQFQRAIHADPSYWHAHHWHSHLLMARGNVRESLAASHRARDLAPNEPLTAIHLAWHFWLARDAPAAVEQSERAWASAPDSAWPPFLFALGCALESRFEKAIPALRTAVARSHESPVMLAALAVCHAEAGESARARALLTKLEVWSRQCRVDYHLALVHLALGETSQSLTRLERALIARLGWIAYVGVDPRLELLHETPRFRELLATRDGVAREGLVIG